jgi:hypothetical protein
MQLRGRTPRVLRCTSFSFRRRESVPKIRFRSVQAGRDSPAPTVGRGFPPCRNFLSRHSRFAPIKTKRHGEIRASFASVRLRRSVVVIARFARPATAAGCLATFSSRDSGLFAREFVRGSFLVGGAPTFRRDCALRLRIHRRESAWSLPTHTAGIPCLHSALSSRPANRSTASASHSAIAHASLVHPVPFVVGLVCHYPSPAANFEFVSHGPVEIRPARGGLSVRGPRLVKLS